MPPQCCGAFLYGLVVVFIASVSSRNGKMTGLFVQLSTATTATTTNATLSPYTGGLGHLTVVHGGIICGGRSGCWYGLRAGVGARKRLGEENVEGVPSRGEKGEAAGMTDTIPVLVHLCNVRKMIRVDKQWKSELVNTGC